jgi:hypothetical protein
MEQILDPAGFTVPKTSLDEAQILLDILGVKLG